jgi:hypothetical protein
VSSSYALDQLDVVDGVTEQIAVRHLDISETRSLRVINNCEDASPLGVRRTR